MRAHAVIEPHRETGGRQWEIVLFLAVPALFAFLSSIGLSYGSQYSESGPWQLVSAPWFLNSGLWLFYEASRLLGYIAITIAAIITAAAIIRRTASEMALSLMAAAILTAVILLWSATRVFQSPW